MAKDNIETVKKRPSCWCCGKKLKPVYNTIKDNSTPDVRRPLRANEMYGKGANYHEGGDPKDPTCDPMVGNAEYDEKRKVWVGTFSSRGIKSRIFTGRFQTTGKYFCTGNCAISFARQLIDDLLKRRDKNKKAWEQLMDAVDEKHPDT